MRRRVTGRRYEDGRQDGRREHSTLKRIHRTYGTRSQKCRHFPSTITMDTVPRFALVRALSSTSERTVFIYHRRRRRRQH